jgi:hypothetical protein
MAGCRKKSRLFDEEWRIKTEYRCLRASNLSIFGRERNYACQQQTWYANTYRNAYFNKILSKEMIDPNNLLITLKIHG